MKWNQLFSHNTRRQEGTADSLLRLLAPSLLGMTVCVLTLCSLTWAWFNMAVVSNITGIQSSEVEVCLVNNNNGTWTATPLEEDVTWTVTPLEEDGTSNATPATKGNIYFIARGTAANAYLAVVYNNTTTYYGPLTLTPVSDDSTTTYPVYSISLDNIKTATNVSVSLHWGTLSEDSTPSETKAARVQDITVSWGGTSTQSQFDLDGDEEPNTTPVIDPSADAPQPQPETPANGDTGDNTNDANDDAQTPDGSTTGDANKEPDATGGNTSDTGETGTSGDSGTTGNGNGDDTGTGGDSGTGSGENTGDVGNVTGDAIPEGGSAKASE